MGYFLNLQTWMKSADRLAKLRAIAAKENKNWRAIQGERYRTPYRLTSPWNPPASNRHGHHCRWVENTSHLRSVGYADEIVNLRHRGWYTDDDFQDETLRGIVFQLPARDGKERYCYGYADPNNDGAAYLCFDPCDDKRDAAMWADSMAERAAEEEREYRARDRAEQRVIAIEEELPSLRASIIALCKEAREVCPALANAPSIKGAIRERVRRLLAQRNDLFEERDELQGQL